MFRPIGFGAPFEERILLYWDKSKHVEDGILWLSDNGYFRNTLFDGESLNAQPTHWMPMPEVDS